MIGTHPKDFTAAKENPGALAGATGAGFCELSSTPKPYSDRDDSDKWKSVGSIAAAMTKPRHARAARVFGLVLDHQHEQAWRDLAGVWFVRLDGAELMNMTLALARAVNVESLHEEAKDHLLEALPIDDRLELADRLGDLLETLQAGAPKPHLLNLMDEAATWADYATRAEKKAFCLCSYNRLSPADQAAFHSYIGGAK